MATIKKKKYLFVKLDMGLGVQRNMDLEGSEGVCKMIDTLKVVNIVNIVLASTYYITLSALYIFCFFSSE